MARDITEIEHKVLESPDLTVVLYEPEIPNNTGNIARLCGAAEVRLHLIHPLGFKTDNKYLKRAGLDYWSEVDIVHHPDFNSFLGYMKENGGNDIICFSKRAESVYTEADISHGQYLMFGKETKGLPQEILNTYHGYKIPIWGNVRSLNLASSVGIVVYHYLQGLRGF